MTAEGRVLGVGQRSPNSGSRGSTAYENYHCAESTDSCSRDPTSPRSIVTMSKLSKTVSNTHRQPPPSLFLGPPSRDASRVSLPAVLLPGAQASSVGAPTSLAPGVPLLRSQSGLNVSTRLTPPADPAGAPSLGGPSAFGRSLPQEQHQQQEAAGQTQADRTEALWAEMQMTLEEVELSAANEVHVFGSEHARALEGLRTAQIALAQAWARSGVDDAEDHAEHAAAMDGPSRTPEGESRPAEEAGSTGGDGDQTGKGRATGHEGTEKKTEEDHGDEFLLAKKRREANDRYFEQVNGGVLAVVAQLEEVATALRAVEQESRDIWSDSGDSRSTSIS